MTAIHTLSFVGRTLRAHAEGRISEAQRNHLLQALEANKRQNVHNASSLAGLNRMLAFYNRRNN